MNGLRRPPRHVALAFAALLWLSTLAAPLAVVNACSCSWLGGTEEVALQAIAQADVAVIGTVTAAEGIFELFQAFGPSVRYTLEVERASVATGAAIDVRAVDDNGGASCGFTFDVGDRWMVAAFSRDGSLQTDLCAGNTPLEGEEAMAERLATSLPFTPSAEVEADVNGSALSYVPAAAAVGLVLAATLTVLAFRRRARSP